MKYILGILFFSFSFTTNGQSRGLNVLVSAGRHQNTLYSYNSEYSQASLSNIAGEISYIYQIQNLFIEAHMAYLMRDLTSQTETEIPGSGLQPIGIEERLNYLQVSLCGGILFFSRRLNVFTISLGAGISTMVNHRIKSDELNLDFTTVSREYYESPIFFVPLKLRYLFKLNESKSYISRVGPTMQVFGEFQNSFGLSYFAGINYSINFKR